MAGRIWRLSVSLPHDPDRGPAHNRSINHTMFQFILTGLVLVVILVLLMQWNTSEIGEGEPGGSVTASAATAHPMSAERAARALAAKLGVGQRERWVPIHRGYITRRGLASLLIELNRNSGSAH